MMKTTDFDYLSETFKNPDRRYAIYPIIHGRIVTDPKFDDYEKCGFAGVVGNVDYTTASPTDSTRHGFPNDEETWQKTAQGFREFARRGMNTWIYDEKGYPSGTAGGYVTERYPQYIAKGLYCYDYWRVIQGPCIYRADVPDDRLWKALLIPTEGGDPIDVTEFLNENNVLYVQVPKGSYHLFMMCKRRLFDGTHATESYSEPRNYISLSDADATRTFIEVTHERYRALLGDEFGKSILATFTDEPSLISWNIRTAVFPILPWHEKYPEEFKARYGYDFHLACVAVALRMGNEQTKRRCDFWEYIADTVADGYFGVIQNWCHENGLKSSGHMFEEERLQAHVFCYGSFYRSMKRMDWPGIDQLETVPEYLMNEQQIPIARFIASFADINGEHEAFTEFSDHCVKMRGGVAPIDYYYQSVNWHHAMGINNFTSYYSWNGISDEEKLQLNQYTARAGTLLRLGKRDSRAAILYPEAAMWDAYRPATTARAADLSESTVSLSRAFYKVSWEMLHRQIDFDYIDTDILTSATIKDGTLIYRDREYKAVILPCAKVLEDAAAQKIIELARCGIPVFCCKELPVLSRESGEVSAYTATIGQLCKDEENIYLSETIEGFGELLDEKLTDKIRFVTTDDYAPMILSHARVTEDGERIVFIANMAKENFCGTVSFQGRYDTVCSADCRTGEISSMEKNICDTATSVSLTIASGEGTFILLK